MQPFISVKITTWCETILQYNNILFYRANVSKNQDLQQILAFKLYYNIVLILVTRINGVVEFAALNNQKRDLLV